MSEFLITWSEQIIVAIIIVVIFEIIIPNTKNKKYLKIIFGIFVMYIIISPLISSGVENFINSIYIESSNFEYNEVTKNNSIDIVNGVTEEIYVDNLKENIIEHLKLQGYKVSINNIDVNKNTNSIENISINVKEKVDKKSNSEQSNNEVEKINEIKIEINKNEEKSNNEEKNNKDENNYIKNYLSDMYDIDINNINIVWE